MALKRLDRNLYSNPQLKPGCCMMNFAKSSFVLILGVLANLLITSQVIAAERVYYRYTSEDGVQVLNSMIPPEYVSKGYEVVSLNGEVLKVVEPAPSEEEAEQVALERKARLEQERRDKLLRRRYSSVKDIEAAKARGLQELQGNISILNSNLSNVRAQIAAGQKQAAIIERGGRSVSDTLLNNLSTLQSEEQNILLQIKNREQEYQSVSDKFDRDMLRFKEIHN